MKKETLLLLALAGVAFYFYAQQRAQPNQTAMPSDMGAGGYFGLQPGQSNNWV